MEIIDAFFLSQRKSEDCWIITREMKSSGYENILFLILLDCLHLSGNSLNKITELPAW